MRTMNKIVYSKDPVIQEFAHLVFFFFFFFLSGVFLFDGEQKFPLWYLQIMACLPQVVYSKFCCLSCPSSKTWTSLSLFTFSHVAVCDALCVNKASIVSYIIISNLQFSLFILYPPFPSYANTYNYYPI